MIFSTAGSASIGASASHMPGTSGIDEQDGGLLVAGVDRQLHQRQLRPLGALADEFGIQADLREWRRQQVAQFGGVADPLHRVFPGRIPTRRRPPIIQPVRGARLPRAAPMANLPFHRRNTDGDPLRASAPAAPCGGLAALFALALLSACALPACSKHSPQAPGAQDAGRGRGARVTVSGDDRIASTLTWRVPDVAAGADPAAEKKRAATALAEGRLYADADSAIPIYLALLKQAPGDAEARSGLQHALAAVLSSGQDALATADDDIAGLRRAHAIAAVARTTAPDDAAVQAYLRRVDLADRLWELNREAERDIRAGHLGESGGGALAKLRAVLHMRPRQPRASQGLAAVESGLIRRAEVAAEQGDFADAEKWLAFADRVRSDGSAVDDARGRVAAVRVARIARLHDEGMQALLQHDGIAVARGKLAEMLRIARARRSGRRRTAPAHRLGGALRRVPSRAGLYRRAAVRRARPADGRRPARRFPHGRRGSRKRRQRQRAARALRAFRSRLRDVEDRGDGGRSSASSCTPAVTGRPRTGAAIRSSTTSATAISCCATTPAGTWPTTAVAPATPCRCCT